MAKGKRKLILAIESSCDETAAAVLEFVDDKKFPKVKTLSSVIKSQTKLHSKMGGVVPEAAARAHVKYIRPVVEKGLRDKGLGLRDLDYIAVTAGPGLLPSLMVGVEFAKALSYATGKPIIPINHMMGHLYSPLSEMQNTKYKILNTLFPIIALIVSGGHTILVLMKDIKNYKVLGQTVDDAAGEAFDKVAKMLKLPYPGGPAVSKLAAKGNPSAINFPRPMIHDKTYNFSFSGLKTAVLYHLERAKGLGLKAKAEQGGSPLSTSHLTLNPSNICASFQQAVVDVLVSKTMRAAEEFKAKSVSLSGGVAANKLLRQTLETACQIHGREFYKPPLELCGDNAEMIGLAAAFKIHNGFKPVPYKKIYADPNLSL